MGFKIVLAPFKDPAVGGDWDEQSKGIHDHLSALIKDYPADVEFKLSTGVEGGGADFPIVILEIVALGSAAFFGIPKAYQKMKDTIKGWREIWSDMERFLNWLKKKERVSRYSIEVAFLSCLAGLSGRTQVDQLELIEAHEFLGSSGYVSSSFENTEVIYYLFIFRENSEKLYITCCDERLQVHVDKMLILNPLTRIHEEYKSG